MKCRMGIFGALVLMLLTAGTAAADSQWTNIITVGEHNMTWDYTESFSGTDAIMFRAYIDGEFGNNDSFVNVWELLKADKEIRKQFQSSIDKEFDVRINNESKGIQVVNIDSTLSTGIIGNIHSADAVVNRYNVSYRWKDSIFNASSIWFLGQSNSPVTIILPPGMDVVNTSGNNNLTKNINTHTELAGFFSPVSGDRGEITINFIKNTTSHAGPTLNATNVTNAAVTQPVKKVASTIRNAGILAAGFVIILLIYVFKVRKK
ncbi:MAG: hypothetical protein O8C64_14870 [Candidatus Methanoperedens sp.]|nr:hypothetical protein [Candidatus Methanoperedens sp.]MCZ7404216.1 hypothetical protein [Candidatus Methanoperedens sp.]